MSRNVVLDLQDIAFVRGGRPILDGVSWTVQRGQHWVLLGANGSGKTTLLKILTGYEWPTRGRIRVLGRVFGQCDIRELRKAIGWVSSAIESKFPANDSSLEVVLSGLEAWLGLYREFTRDEHERANAALAAVRAEHLSRQRFETLSQGEQQRVMIARALVNEPALLVLDEPCAGLDPVARESFLASVGCLAADENGPAIMLVTHHVEEIRPWITHAMLLREGRMAGAGEAASTLTSENLSSVFDRTCELSRQSDGYALRVLPD